MGFTELMESLFEFIENKPTTTSNLNGMFFLQPNYHLLCSVKLLEVSDVSTSITEHPRQFAKAKILEMHWISLHT
jgi:hypothetical protein